jgi:hypothetical protein
MISRFRHDANDSLISGPVMTQAPFSTHEVLNQSPPFWDVDLFALDRPLADAVAANGGAAAQTELSEFGRHWGSAAMAARGRVANENTPKLRSFDSRGNRRDEVEFHPAYHELMAHSAHAGVHIRPGTRKANRPVALRKCCVPRNSTSQPRSRPVISARSP